MRSRLLHAFLTLTAFVAAWLVVTPAFASNADGLQATANANVSTVTKIVEASFAPVTPPPAPAPANMRAPLCDARGAITFAPPPQMQDVEVSLDTGLLPEDCMTSAHGDSRHASRGPAPLPVDARSASTDSAIASAVPRLPRASRELIPAPAASTSCSRPGFRSTVDRPPRV